MNSFDVAVFNEKLKNPQFLGSLWPKVRKIPFLKKAIIDFSRDPKNAHAVESAFAVIPLALKESIRA